MANIYHKFIPLFLMQLFGFSIERKRVSHSPTLQAAIDEFLSEKSRPGKWAGKTLKNYKSSFKQILLYFPDAKIDELTREHFQSWIDARTTAGIKPWTIKKQCVHISHLFNWIVDHRGWVKSNPMTRTEKPTPRRRVKPFMNERQVDRILARLSGIKHDITYIYLRTAMRPGELLCSKDTLNWLPPRYDPDNHFILLETTKTEDSARIELIKKNDSGKLIETIEKYTTPAGCLEIGLPLEMYRQSLSEIYWEMGLLERGYDVQCLRRTAAYLCWRYTGCMETCRKLLRHKNIETTINFYLDLLPADIRENLEKVRIGAPSAPLNNMLTN